MYGFLDCCCFSSRRDHPVLAMIANLFRVLTLFWLVMSSAFASGTYPSHQIVDDYEYQATLGNGSGTGPWGTAQPACDLAAINYGKDGQGNYRKGVLTGTKPNYGCDLYNVAFNLHTAWTILKRPLAPYPSCDTSRASPAVAGTLNAGQCTCSTPLDVNETQDACVPSTCPPGQEKFGNTNFCVPICTPPTSASVSVTGVFQGCLIPAGANPQAAKCANAKGTVENYYSSPAPATANSVCAALGGNAGCSIDINWTMNMTTDGVKMLYGTGTVSGKTCTQAKADAAAAVPPKAPPMDSDKPGAPAPTPCKPGTFPGTVNGVSVCVPPAPDKPVGTSDTTTKTNSDGSTTTTKKDTDCTGSSCTTTTTTTTTPAGGGTGTTTTTKEDKPRQTFCEENPQLAICKSGSFTGSCDSAPACSGDAIQCAVAASTFATNCKLQEVTKPVDDLVAITTAARSGADGLNTDAMKASAAGAPVSVGSFDVGGKGWSRSCPADPVIDVPFGTIHSWTMPLSKLCTPLQILSMAGVGLTLLASLLWVIGGRKT